MDVERTRAARLARRSRRPRSGGQRSTTQVRIARRVCAITVLGALACGADTAGAEFQVQTGWGSPGTGDGQFTTPLGIASSTTSGVYVADASPAAGRVQRFDRQGTFLGSFGTPGSAFNQFARAGHVAVDTSDNVYVTDPGNARVGKYLVDGRQEIAPWGTRGNGDGQFQDPTGVAADARGNVFVVDQVLNRVQRFNSDGAYDIQWGTTGTGPEQFMSARDVAVDVFGDVYVVDGALNRVRKFTSDGVLLEDESWGSTGAGEGQFNAPNGIATDGSGNVFVADTGNQRVQVFTSRGAFLTQFGGAGSGPGQFNNPVDVASDASGAAYVVDQGNVRVQRFEEPVLPLPVAGQSANIALVSGTVLVQPPNSSKFVPLKGARQIPIGSRVQTKNGRAMLTTASDLRDGQQRAEFYAGLFVLTQRREPAPVTDLTLAGGTFTGCTRGASRTPRGAPRPGNLSAQAAAKKPAKRSKRSVRKLWGDGKGRFRTKGTSGSASVRGTKWLTEDRCDGTLFRVVRGRVEVRDLVRNRTIVLTAGKSYLARRR